ncbi:MAG: VCBS repeat-containing protein [Balneolaceae bacterium]
MVNYVCGNFSIVVKKYSRILPLLSLLFSLGAGCGRQNTRFRLLPTRQTGVSFSNEVKSSPDFNILNYLYFYDGGGVSIGDVNGDDLPDLYFTANMKPNSLYLNNGDFTFTNITQKAGVAGEGDWSTGTTMADVNGDGLLDIYLCHVDYLSQKGKNQLFINNGDSTFTDRAREYGLDFSGYSKQAAFFDMDNDGDLDMFLLNHSVHTKESFIQRSKALNIPDVKAGDRLYRNDGGKFTDVTKQSGIHSSLLGYGLSVTVSDVNGDHYQDIYVTNDFHENDYLYLNQRDGTFKDVLSESIPHTSRASMGSDIADINNDLKPDIAVLDMLPNTEEGRKTSVSSEQYKVYSIQREYGYHPQLIRNTLQLNLGKNLNGDPIFSDIAPMAGVYATDWSWSPLIFDMDNDGFKDLFITNGVYRRPNDWDYLAMVGAKETQRSLNEGINPQNISLIDSMPHVKIPNKAFHNKGNLSFSSEADRWGLAAAGYSNGAAYGDLDNDGDLDLVVNNLDAEASIYKNETIEQDRTSFLTVSLKGSGKNTKGIGAKAVVWANGLKQMAELTSTRGFESSVDPTLSFGLGDAKTIDTLKIIWPDGRETVRTGVGVNQHLRIDQSTAKTITAIDSSNSETIFKTVDDPMSPEFKHSEDGFNEFNQQPLMPYQLSDEGPAMAAGDVNGDGLEDLFFGGAKWQAGSLYIQQPDGRFKRQEVSAFEQDNAFEDTDAAFFDANNDGALDLYVVSGGDEYTVNSPKLYDRFYLNDGHGRFARVTDAFPTFGANGSVVVPFDYDGDGDNDVFVGSRSVPRNYGVTPYSYLFQNQGDGTFREVTDKAAPGLKDLGMISDAQNGDVNGDGKPDLIVAGDWMPVTVFINKDGQLVKKDNLHSGNGLWQSVETADVDDDGDIDILAGNMGRNTTLDANGKQPLIIYIGDFNGDGTADPVIGRKKGENVYPIEGRDMLLQTMPYLKDKFPTYQSFANKTLEQIFSAKLLNKAAQKSVDELASCYFENKGNGSFQKHMMPPKVQAAPLYTFFTGDFNADGHTDILTGGNLFKVQPVYGGPYDASYGWLLEGNSRGSFAVLNPSQSGFFIDGEIRRILGLKTQSRRQTIVIGINDKQPVLLNY